MKIMILGATGYLGFNIVKRLLSESNISLTIAVRDFEKLRSFFTNQQLQSINVISCDLSLIEYVLRENRFDYVINTVCTYKPDEKSLYADMFASNLSFPLSVLNLGIKHNVKKFLTIGTTLSSEVNVYSFSKNKFAEFGKYLSEHGQIDFIELKLEMFYGGEHETSERFIKNCMLKLKKNEPLKLTYGTQIRDMIRVEDVIEVIVKILKETDWKGYHQFSLGYGEAHTIRETVEYMKSVMHSCSELHFGALPMRRGEQDSVADISWLKDIDYHFKYSWSTGLNKDMEDEK